MNAKACPTPTQTHTEQYIYANILEKGMYVGLLLLFITFAVYVFGIVRSVVPLDEIANYWALDSHTYLEKINEHYIHHEHLPTGWAWIGLAGHGDFMNFIPIAILAGTTMLCYAAIVPTLIARKDSAYVVMCILEVLVLGLATSGLLAVGGH